MGKNGEKNVEEGMPFGLEGMMKLNGRFEDAMKRGQESFATGLRTLQEESLEFLKRRLEHTSECVEQSHRSGNINDLFVVQQKWMADLAHDCYDESVRFGSLMQRLMQQASGFPHDDEERPRKDR